MIKLAYYFTDKVTSQAVYIWVDKFGDVYLAVDQYGYRVKIQDSELSPKQKTAARIISQQKKPWTKPELIPITEEQYKEQLEKSKRDGKGMERESKGNSNSDSKSNRGLITSDSRITKKGPSIVVSLYEVFPN
jgi:hypothetical protein